MTPAQRDLAYAASRSILTQGTVRAAAIQTIANSGVPSGSASIVVDVYLALRRGSVFKRALAESDMERFLTGIALDDGAKASVIALNAFARHISYRESVGHAQPGNRALFGRHVAFVGTPDNALGSFHNQDDFDEEVRRSRGDRLARQERLQTATPIPRRVMRISFVFERNPDVIAEVLERANGVCEICKENAPFVRARDGTPFLEVHHSIPLAQGGEDIPENAVAACPNCHRKQHFG